MKAFDIICTFNAFSLLLKCFHPLLVFTRAQQTHTAAGQWQVKKITAEECKYHWKSFAVILSRFLFFASYIDVEQ
jgi:hypothetical protein